jgi:hypothetical protein
MLRTPVHTERGNILVLTFPALLPCGSWQFFYGSSLFLPVIVFAEPLASDRFVNIRSHDEYDGRDHRARPCKPSQAYRQTVPMCSVVAGWVVRVLGGGGIRGGRLPDGGGAPQAYSVILLDAVEKAHPYVSTSCCSYSMTSHGRPGVHVGLQEHDSGHDLHPWVAWVADDPANGEGRLAGNRRCRAWGVPILPFNVF